MVTAFLFPGQGSQQPGAGLPFRETDSWRLVGEAAPELAGLDPDHLLCEAGADELVGPLEAQVSTFLISMLALDQLRARKPDVVAGHSLGEYSALVAAGALSFRDGVRLVAARGAAMARAAQARPGTMAAVMGLDPDRVEKVCAEAGECWLANDNVEGQAVVSGTAAAIDAATPRFKEEGARMVRPIPVGGAYHTPLMEPARAELREAIATSWFQEAETPVVTNVDARPHRDGFPDLLSAQLTARVRWRETMTALRADTVLEVGPGKVLTNLARRGLQGVDAHRAGTPEEIRSIR